ncbi:galactosyltransferase-related protein [Fulvivirga sediminis]|uniref:Galactosyltransferase C-terminal domain-containing protein n=1 Tax=Fulvivirga sediminis TaxID=2803949 RepID=A0A937K1X8_9BACT|nr:galactosyltransferase-related protein [Fulvivirga sediminis]MBL3659034.1 hypothetical protein [Fulvivirga sediminis]
MISLDIIIPWKDREELSRCLKDNSTFFAEKGIEPGFIIVNCGGNRQRVRELVDSAEIDFSVRILHFEYQGFNKSLTLNLGIHKSVRENIMVLDTDVILGKLDIQCLKDSLGNNAFVTLERILEEKPEPEEFPEACELVEIGNFIEFKAANGNTALVEMNRKGLLDSSRSGPGIIALSKKALEDVGGYNSELEGWGWEDLDLISRLQLKNDLKRESMGMAVHMTHDDDVRYITPEFDFKRQNEQRNFQVCLINYRLGILEGSLKEDKEYIDLIEEELIHD